VFDYRWLLAVAAVAALATALTACGAAGSHDAKLRGKIRIDGSSAVAPLTRVLARRFEQRHPGVEIAVGESGTEQGFEKLCAGEIDVDGSSRAMLPTESKACEAAGVGFAEAAVANQAIVVLRNPRNPQSCIRIEQLAQIWRPEKPISRWTEVVNGVHTFPVKIERFGPAPSSAAFAYFTETVNGVAGRQTKAYIEAGRDEARTIARVANAGGGIGYLDFPFFPPLGAKGVKPLEVESKESGFCVPPSVATVQDGSYNPLGRELRVYPSTDALEDPATKTFLDYYLEHADKIADSVGLVPLGGVQLERSERGLQQ
jgi:phosphate transport system substrate-binding protein